MKAVMFYQLSPDGMRLAVEHFPGHRARLLEFQSRGLCFMAGPFADPSQGAMGIFASREAAEEFMAEDPFILHGVVAHREIREWKEGIA
jgi:uncharacterized protein YciI